MPYSQAPSGQWPRGSGNEYLWGAGLWIGARIGGDVAVTTGQPERELRPDSGIFDTIYEAKSGYVTRPWPNERPTGFRLPHPQADDDDERIAAGGLDAITAAGWGDRARARRFEIGAALNRLRSLRLRPER